MMPDPFTSATTVTATPPDIPIPTSGQFGKWDVYPMLWAETARISDRRQTANTLYLSVNSLLIGGIAFLAQQSQLQSFSLLIVQVVVALAGYVIARQWHRLLEKYRLLLKVRYETLEQIEEMPDFPGAVKMHVIERDRKELYGFSKIEEFIPQLFRLLYISGTLLLIAGTIAVRIHFGLWLSHYLSIPTLH